MINLKIIGRLAKWRGALPLLLSQYCLDVFGGERWDRSPASAVKTVAANLIKKSPSFPVGLLPPTHNLTGFLRIILYPLLRGGSVPRRVFGAALSCYSRTCSGVTIRPLLQRNGRTFEAVSIRHVPKIFVAVSTTTALGKMSKSQRSRLNLSRMIGLLSLVFEGLYDRAFTAISCRRGPLGNVPMLAWFSCIKEAFTGTLCGLSLWNWSHWFALPYIEYLHCNWGRKETQL